MPTPLQYALAEIGTTEYPGPQDNPRIIDYSLDSGIPGIEDDETAWCSIFVNWCCYKAGWDRSNQANARSWLQIGKPKQNPVPGDIVIFWRENPESTKGHVGFFLGFNDDGSKVYCLGGNQKNRVCIDTYNTSEVLGYRKIGKVKKGAVPQPILKRGSRGIETERLQEILQMMYYDCGDVDGFFGPSTEEALKEFQSDHHLKTSGIYGVATKNVMEGLMT